jgi:hypothetical protein
MPDLQLPELNKHEIAHINLAYHLRTPEQIHDLPRLQGPAVGCNRSGVDKTLDQIKLTSSTIRQCSNPQLEALITMLRCITRCNCRICSREYTAKLAKILLTALYYELKWRHESGYYLP